LTTNAIESMATTDGARALGVTCAIRASGGVMVSVNDTVRAEHPRGGVLHFILILPADTAMAVGRQAARHAGEYFQDASPAPRL